MVNDGFHDSTRQDKVWKLIHYFSIQYAIKNDQYPKKLQEVVYVMGKVKFKSENNNNKSNTKIKNKNGGGEKDK